MLIAEEIERLCRIKIVYVVSAIVLCVFLFYSGFPQKVSLYLKKEVVRISWLLSCFQSHFSFSVEFPILISLHNHFIRHHFDIPMTTNYSRCKMQVSAPLNFSKLCGFSFCKGIRSFRYSNYGLTTCSYYFRTLFLRDCSHCPCCALDQAIFLPPPNIYRPARVFCAKNWKVRS